MCRSGHPDLLASASCTYAVVGGGSGPQHQPWLPERQPSNQWFYDRAPATSSVYNTVVAPRRVIDGLGVLSIPWTSGAPVTPRRREERQTTVMPDTRPATIGRFAVRR